MWDTLSCYSELYNSLDVDLGQKQLFAQYKAFSYENFGGGDYHFYLFGMLVSHTFVFYGLNILLTLWGWILPGMVEPMRWNRDHAPRALAQKAILWVTMLHFLSPVIPYFLYDPHLASNPTMFDPEAVPGIVTFLLQLGWSYVVTDFLFYCGHRLLHTRLLYAPIHKRHHQFRITIGWAAEYAHPLEWILGNVFPVIGGPLLFRFHFSVYLVWLAMAMAGTTFGHSGIEIPVLNDDGFHDFHHSHNVGNYGSMQYLDYFLGTDRHWKDFKKKRDRARGKTTDDDDDD